LLGPVEVPGEGRRRNSGGEKGRGQERDDYSLEAVSGPPQLVPAQKQPPAAPQWVARTAC
jgi:hypothetical protein